MWCDFFLVWVMRYVCKNPGSAFCVFVLGRGGRERMETGEREGERTHSLFCKLDKRVSAGFTTGRTSFVKEEVEGRDGPELGEESQERVLVHRRM
jgi:hypothetical protein